MDDMSSALESLRAEHETIRALLEILGRMCSDITRGSVPPWTDARMLVDILRELADALHHGKEERVLFPAIQAADVGPGSVMVTALLAEHLAARDLLREMHLALTTPADWLTFAQAASGYSSLMRGHIRKEDDGLFPAVAAAMDPEELARLDRVCEEQERSLMGPDRRDSLDRRIKEIEAGYPR